MSQVCTGVGLREPCHATTVATAGRIPGSARARWSDLSCEELTSTLSEAKTVSRDLGALSFVGR